MMRIWLTVQVVIMFATTAAGQTQTPTSFNCTQTSDVIGDGFTLDCAAADPNTSTANLADLTIKNVRRYQSSLDVSDWLYFDVVAGVDIDRLDLDVKLHYADGTFLSCSESVRDQSAGQISEELVIPDICGSDIEWSAVEITAPA